MINTWAHNNILFIRMNEFWVGNDDKLEVAVYYSFMLANQYVTTYSKVMSFCFALELEVILTKLCGFALFVFEGFILNAALPE